MDGTIPEDTSLNNSFSTTVVRIKRRLGTETPDSIYVSSKKKCLEASSSSDTIPSSSSTVLTKLITVSENDHLGVHLKNALQLAKTKLSTKLRNSYKLGYQQPSKEEIRKKVKSEKAASKFKFICSIRDINVSDLEKENLNIQLFDAITENETPLSVALSKEEVITCNGKPLQCSKTEYVYDLYYTYNPVEHSTWIENICEVQPYEDKDTLVYDDEEDDQKEKLESDDENDEDNWRNDYPDEDEEDLLYDDEEDYLCKHFEKTKIGTDESFDEEDYDESGDFDVDGNLVSNGRYSPFFTLKKIVRGDHPKVGNSSSEDEEYY